MSPPNSIKRPAIRLRYFIPYLLIFLLVPIGTFLLGKWIDVILYLPRFPPFPFNILLGVSIMVGGAIVGVRATRQLRDIGKGLPWGEANVESLSKRLVTDGIYAHTRNPMSSDTRYFRSEWDFCFSLWVWRFLCRYWF